MNKSAIFSKDRSQRFALTRVWDTEKPMVACIGLNPSTANEVNDDPTIRYLLKVLPLHGYGGLTMLNLFSLVSSDPSRLLTEYSNQRANEIVRGETIAGCKDVVFCWVNFKEAGLYSIKVISKFENALCFGITKAGNPMHPMSFVRRGIHPSNVTLSPFRR